MRRKPTSLIIPDDTPSVLARAMHLSGFPAEEIALIEPGLGQGDLQRAMHLSGFPAEEIAAFEFSPYRQNRTRCIIWRWHGPQIEKYYFYTQKGAAND